MKKASLFAAFYFLTFLSNSAQNMIQNELFKTMAKEGQIVDQQNNTWQIKFEGTILITLVDEPNNRMRIIAPAAEEKKMKKDDFKKCLDANFHSALDVKYALFDEYLWSIYVHPLKELSKNQVIDAMYQVRNAAATYGTSYQSSNLTFNSNTSE